MKETDIEEISKVNSDLIFEESLKKRIGFKKLDKIKCCMNCGFNGGAICNKWYPLIFNHSGFDGICDHFSSKTLGK